MLLTGFTQKNLIYQTLEYSKIKFAILNIKFNFAVLEINTSVYIHNKMQKKFQTFNISLWFSTLNVLLV